jgi:hypothetical protein
MDGVLPIRKVAPDRVALTSYYGKVFASRSSKRVNDYGQWIRNMIMARGLDENDSTILDLHTGDCFDNLFPAPKIYSTVAMGFRSFAINVVYPNLHPEEVERKPVLNTATESDKVMHSSVMSNRPEALDDSLVHKPPPVKPTQYWKAGPISFTLSFNHTLREELFGKAAMKKYEKHGSIIVGRRTPEAIVAQDNDPYIVLDRNNQFYLTLPDGSLKALGDIEALLNMDSARAPVDFAELKVMGRTIPFGLILGYEIGLSKLMEMLNVRPRRVKAGTRVNLEPHEFSLVFSDETLVFPKENKKASLILAGFNEYHRSIRQYSVYEFDHQGIYLNVLESAGASTRYLREIDLLYQMFVDPITRELLIEMKEPTDFRGLLFRCCDMLLIDQHPDEFDPAFMRIKGYERMAGAAYSEIVRTLRAHNGRPGKSRLPLDLNPYAVWKNIAEDPSKAQVFDINPIENLKEMEAVTYSGVGGRNSRSMTKNTRLYHPNDMGTISESTVDSSDVAINTYLSADPQFTSLRGMSRRYELEKTGVTALLSTSALISAGSDRDD